MERFISSFNAYFITINHSNAETAIVWSQFQDEVFFCDLKIYCLKLATVPALHGLGLKKKMLCFRFHHKFSIGSVGRLFFFFFFFFFFPWKIGIGRYFFFFFLTGLSSYRTFDSKSETFTPRMAVFV